MENEILTKNEEEIIKQDEREIVVKTKFDFRTMKYCNKYIIYYKNKAYLLSLILGLVVVGLGAYTLVTALMANQNILFGVIIALMGLFMVYSGLSLDKKIDAQLTSYFSSNPVREQVCTITNEKITIARENDTDGGISYDWAYVSEIHAIPEFYMLFVNKRTPLIIDRNPLSISKGTKKELDEIIKEKAELKPFKEIAKNIITKEIKFVHSYVEVKNEDSVLDAEVVKENQNAETLVDSQDNNDDNKE